MKKIKDEIMMAAMADFKSGIRVPDVCKKHGISETAFYRFKKTYADLTSAEIRQVRALGKKEAALNRKIHEQERIIKALKAALKKKF